MANDKKKMVEAITAQEVDFAQWYTSSGALVCWFLTTAFFSVPVSPACRAILAATANASILPSVPRGGFAGSCTTAGG